MTESETKQPSDPTPQDEGSEQKSKSIWIPVRRILRARIAAGLIFILPIWITYLLVRFVFEMMRDTSLWIVELYLASDYGKRIVKRWGISPELLAEDGLGALPDSWQWIIGIFCVFLTIVLLYIIGMLTANFFGRRVVGGIENLVKRVPLVKTVYGACKQILEAFTGDKSQEFQRVALVPFPSREMRSIGFITAVTKDMHTGEELCAVFLATTPNPTTGYVFFVRRADVIELDWSFEDAISVIMSGGGLVPPQMPLAAWVKSGATTVPGGQVLAVPLAAESVPSGDKLEKMGKS